MLYLQFVSGLEVDVAAVGEEPQGDERDRNHIPRLEHGSGEAVGNIFGADSRPAVYDHVEDGSAVSWLEFGFLPGLFRNQSDRLIELEYEMTTTKPAPRGGGDEDSGVNTRRALYGKGSASCHPGRGIGLELANFCRLRGAQAMQEQKERG